MMASRGTQPYRAGARQPSQALQAMLAGKPAFLGNPMDLTRRIQRRAGKGHELALLLLQGRSRP